MIDCTLQQINKHTLQIFKQMKRDSSYPAKFRREVEELSRTHQIKKRGYAESFGERDYDSERYGQEITEDFFSINQGHGVVQGYHGVQATSK